MRNLAFKNVPGQKNRSYEFINLPNSLKKSPPGPKKPFNFSTQDAARIQFQN